MEILSQEKTFGGTLATVKMSIAEYNSLRIKERRSAIEVANKLILPSKNNRYERVDLTLTPYLVFPISLMGRSECLWIYAIAPTQSGKTLLLQIFFADRVDQERGTMLAILPDQGSGDKSFKEKFISIIECNPFLDEHVLEPRKQNLAYKNIHLDNSSLYPGYAGRPITMNSNTCNAVMLDELRLHPIKVKGETNSIEYAEDRTTTYRRSGRAQHIAVTTPATEGDLMHRQIGRPYHSEYWWMTTCPKCERVQILDIYENFVFDESTNMYLSNCVCKYGCGHEFSDRDEKRPLNKDAIYVKKIYEGEFREKVPEPQVDKHVIVRWTSESSPFRSFQMIAEKYEQCKEEPSALNNFNQAWRARFTRKQKSKTTVKGLEKQINPEIKRYIVPPWTKVITMGADAQGDGFFYWTHCWGANGYSACIDADKIESHYLVDVNYEAVEEKFRRYFEDKIYVQENGKKWAAGLWAIDTGGNRTQQMYDAIWGFKKCIPCKGRPMDVNVRFTKTGGLPGLYLINTAHYYDKTDHTCFQPHWYLYSGINKEVLRQYINLRLEIEGKVDKQGNEIEHWEKKGQNDWRVAAAHAEIALDIRIEGGIKFRECLDEDGFMYNPVDIILKKTGNPDAIETDKSRLPVNDKLKMKPVINPTGFEEKPVFDYSKNRFSSGGVMV